jgi:hypothetical protein
MWHESGTRVDNFRMSDWYSWGGFIGVAVGLGISRLINLDTWLKIVTVIACAILGDLIDKKVRK